MIKKILLSFLALIIALCVYVSFTLKGTGFFKEIEPHFDGSIAGEINLPGIEDIAVNYEDKFLLLSIDDRAGRRDGKPTQGGIYHMSLEDSSFTPKLISQEFSGQFYPHGISLLKIDSAKYRLLVINHTGDHSVDSGADPNAIKHSIEVFTLYGDSLVHEESKSHELIFSPNDVVAIDEEKFYYSNDHGSITSTGRLLEDYVGLARSNVAYFDGNDYSIVAEDIMYANGINYDFERNLLYVASPRGFLMKVFSRNEDGSLNFIEDIDCNTGVDNIELDQEGNVWIGCHPNLTHFAEYAKGNFKYAPSEIIKITYRGKGDYDLDQVYLSNGEDMSGSTVAIKYGDLIYTGNVMDSKAIILKQN